VSPRQPSRVSRRALLARGAAGGAAVLAASAASAAGAGAAASAPGAAPATASPAAVATRARTADGRWTRIRRVVTSDGADGRGVVIADGEPGNAVELNGTRLVRLWETPGIPAALPLRGDAGATAGNAYREGFAGTSFYVAELPGGSRAPSIPMHRNATVDYMAILSGRIVFKIEDREIELAAGDTLVQGGNLHTWINRWEEPCLLLFVVVTGARAKQG
jgi:mannose-6-phosphate isomerase-like protein (cupin superfamily)